MDLLTSLLYKLTSACPDLLSLSAGERPRSTLRPLPHHRGRVPNPAWRFLPSYRSSRPLRVRLEEGSRPARASGRLHLSRTGTPRDSPDGLENQPWHGVPVVSRSVASLPA